MVAINWERYLGFDPMDSGWIPPENRTLEQTRLHMRVMSETPSVTEAIPFGDLPEMALFTYLELKHFKKLLWRINQQIGSCVGAGAARAYGQSILGDLEYRGDREAIEPMFPWATWGVGRRMGGLRGRGDGSFGAAQAEAVKKWGMLRASDSRLPQPTFNGDWLKWTGKQELEWSWPNSFPVKISDEDAFKYAMGEIIDVNSTDEFASLYARGWSGTLASMFGTQGPKLRNGVMLADWDGRWAHQMSCSGYATHPQLGRIWLIDNQWAFNAHPVCPFLMSLIAKFAEELRIEFKGLYGGSFWILDSIMAKIIRTGEVIGHANTKGFDPERPILPDWSKVSFV